MPIPPYQWPNRVRWLTALLLIPLAAAAQPCLELTPMAKRGNCPTGYTASGAYCIPGPQATLALERRGNCPTGYRTSGAYCLAGPQARLAIPRIGSTCPSGWLISGDYCLKR
ncbi:hypothetical protein F2Q65_12295 [Thiohalocapsa marina]|uniref:Uncharacterized protein n=1 Tax=Thiohalocapsa marina TaxID=424902 RepID=A0A5M8FL55_9GAMM|nr:hypothetical protein [Thiohalocapsa marina]KAA6184486.1 hypothetical protein F2Q65_12295 [Thiohalocapsa marina]